MISSFPSFGIIFHFYYQSLAGLPFNEDNSDVKHAVIQFIASNVGIMTLKRPSFVKLYR